MSHAPDIKGIQAELDWLSSHKPHVKKLIETLKTVCDDDPQFLIGAVDCVEESEEDTQTLIDWIQAGEGVDYSSVLMFAVELDQIHRPENYEFEEDDEDE